MTLWADIYDVAGARLGDGPIPLLDAQVTRVLDGVGSVSFSVPYGDARALALLAHERTARIFYRPNETAATREIGRGIIRKIQFEVADGGGYVAAIDGPDDLDGLVRIVTKLQRKYSAQSVSAIATSLVGLVSGWSVTASGGNTTDARFDGPSVFKALLAIAEAQGLHVRAGTTAKTVEVGAFGSSNGLRLTNASDAMGEVETNDNVALIQSLSVAQDSEAVCNRLYPIGAGIGEAWQTIFESTRNTPYIRNVVLVNGIDQHFLEDSASIALYGIIEKMGKFQVAPLSNSPADVENAANALYDMAAAWLTRYAVRQDVYQVTVRKVRVTVRPGDKVRLVYNGVIEREGARARYLDINEEFWVMECTESFGLEGDSLAMTLSSIDRHEESSAKIVIGALEDLSVDGVSVKPYPNRTAYVYDRLIDIFNPAEVPIQFTNATQKLNRCLMKIKTAPFISTVAPDVTNTTHKHDVITSTTYAGPYYWRAASMLDRISGDAFNVLLPISVESASFAGRTGVESAEDFITVDYGLHEDTATPEGVRVYVNGVDYTTALGGSWFPSGGSNEVDLDITSAILDFTLQQEHIIQIQCTGGQGRVEVSIEVYEIIQSILL